MERIFRYEEKRTKRWIAIFFCAFFVLVAAIAWLFFLSIRTLSEQRTFDVFDILWEDREVLREFGQEVLTTFVIEFPKMTLNIGVTLVILFIGFWIVTRRKRIIVKRRVEELAKRKKNYNNTYREVKE